MSPGTPLRRSYPPNPRELRRVAAIRRVDRIDGRREAQLHRTARRELLLRGGGLPLTTLVHEAYLGMSVLVVHVLGR